METTLRYSWNSIIRIPRVVDDLADVLDALDDKKMNVNENAIKSIPIQIKITVLIAKKQPYTWKDRPLDSGPVETQHREILVHVLVFNRS